MLESRLTFKKAFERIGFEDEGYLCYFENDSFNNEGPPTKNH